MSNDIEKYIFGEIERQIKKSKLKKVKWDRTTNVLESGILDSRAFLGLITGIESHFNLQIDFNTLSPGVFSSIGGLIEHIEKCAKVKKIK